MAQYLKEEVRRRITRAALREFASEGHDGATMASIAARADVSTGNLYRYFDGKTALFEAVVPERLANRFRTLLSERLRAAEDVDDVRTLPSDHRYWTAAGRLLDFAVDHRLEVVILLGRAGGSRYEGMGEDVVRELARAARDHSPGLAERAASSAAVAFDLEQIYRCFVSTLVRILERFDDEAEIREATAVYERYHLVGLGSLMERG